MKMYWIVTLGVLIPLTLGACSAITREPSRPTPGAVDPTPTPDATPLAPVDGVDPAAAQVVTLACEHLARKLGVPVEEIVVFSVEPVTWPDSSLGCPQPGVAVTPAETPGYLVLLESGGKAYTYHTDTVDRVVLCDVRPPGEIYNPP